MTLALIANEQKQNFNWQLHRCIGNHGESIL